MSKIYHDVDIPFTVTKQNAIDGEIESENKCTAANGIVDTGTINRQYLKVGQSITEEDVIPWARWRITNHSKDGEEQIEMHRADMEPIGMGRRLISLNDIDKAKLICTWRKDIMMTLVRHTYTIKQYQGGSPDDPIRRKVRTFIKENYPGWEEKNLTPADFAAVAEKFGCGIDKVIDTYTRMDSSKSGPRIKESGPKRIRLV